MVDQSCMWLQRNRSNHKLKLTFSKDHLEKKRNVITKYVNA